MTWVMEFEGTLQAPTAFVEGNPYQALPGTAEPDVLILNALWPLQRDLDGNLARGDQEGALSMAYGALSQLCKDLGVYDGDSLAPGQTRVHALMVELQPLPLECDPDGTIANSGIGVRVGYRNWTVDDGEGEIMADALRSQCQAQWAGAEITVQRTVT